MTAPTLIMNSYDLNRWKTQFPSIVWCCDDAFVGHTIGFATAIGKLDALVEKIKQAAFPTFFGIPAVTEFSADGLASFGFAIFKASDYTEHKEHPGSYHEKIVRMRAPGARMLMNGGLIFHPEWRKDETGKEIVHYAGGSWSIHT